MGRGRRISDTVWRLVESDVVNTEMAWVKIAKKHGVSISAMNYQSKKRNWNSKKKLHNESVGAAIQGTTKVISSLVKKLETLDPVNNSEDAKEWRKTMLDIKELRSALKQVNGDGDTLGDVLRWMNRWMDFLQPRVKDKDFWEQMVRYSEEFVEWLQN